MKMTREEFKDIVLNILLNQKFGNIGVLFDTEDMSRYKITQYDEEEWGIESSMPLGEFLDELYEDLILSK
jgi:hypothetical protein